MSILKGKKLTEEHKRKISEAHIGKSSGMLGKRHSEKTKKKMSSRKVSNETKKKISENHSKYWLGKKKSKEHKEKISNTMKGRKRKQFSDEWKRNIGKSRAKFVGEESCNWKGGISLNKTAYSTFMNKKRRVQKNNAGGEHSQGDWENLKAQYNYTCPACGKREPDIRLTEDHIIPLIKGGSDNIENIQPLCRICNSKKHTKIVKYEFIGMKF